jgi:hypothetical protein
MRALGRSASAAPQKVLNFETPSGRKGVTRNQPLWKNPTFAECRVGQGTALNWWR